MKKTDFKEFTVDVRVDGASREVQFTTGDVVVTEPALIIKGVTAADAWRLISLLGQGLLSEKDIEKDKVDRTATSARIDPATGEDIPTDPGRTGPIEQHRPGIQCFPGWRSFPSPGHF